IKWNDMVSLGYEGLSLYWHHDNFRIGTGLVIDPGRDTSHVDTISFTAGDERLKGLGKIDLSPGLKVFASYQLSSINFMVSGVKYLGSQNKGIVVNFGASAPLQLGSGFTLTPHAGANWADSKYMQTYYGVTALQSSKSTFAEFDTKAGMRDVNGGITLTYAFNRHWSTSTDFTATQLLGDAKKSPISFSDTGMMVMTAVGYHF
ncbi:MAG: MipA/OmpV family protein, partial [Rhizomicrobium sp.]